MPTAQPGLTGRRTAGRQVPAGVDDGLVDAELFQLQQGLIDGIALADAAEIQSHVRLGQPCGVGGRVQHQGLVSHGRPGLAKPLFRRQLPLSPSASPELCEGSDGDVEGTLRLLADLLCAGQNVPQVVTQREGLRRGGGIAEPTEFAVAGVVAEAGIQGRDSRERRVEGPVCEFLIRSVQ